MKKILFGLFTLLFSSLVYTHNFEAEFTGIYQRAIWGRNAQGKANSGDNSIVKNVRPYMDFLQNFLKEKNINSVVDVGCGDWEFSQFIDWSGINYLGYDVVKYVIDNNIKKYSTPNINFFHANAVEMELPKAELLICKDVLQHLNDDVNIKFLSTLKKYKYCLITNNIQFTKLLEAPYEVVGVEVLLYEVKDKGQIIQTILIDNSLSYEG